MQRIIRAMSQAGPMGRLYKMDMRLRPTGKSGALVTPLSEFRRYYDEDRTQLWERQTLTRARPVCGDPAFGATVMAVVTEAAYGKPWKPEFAAEIAAMREKMEGHKGKRDVKRGPGGQVDVEFLVQMLQLKYGGAKPEIRTPNTWAGLDALHAAKLLSPADHAALRVAYDFLRLVEGRLRITTNRALDEIPDAAGERDKLARRLGFDGANAFLTELDGHFKRTRETFRRLVEVSRSA
jgi:glutamate-ammonia-ligase adenylyltransferase